MKKVFFVIVLLFLVHYMGAQDKQTDSLKQLLLKPEEDTSIFNNLLLISLHNLFSNSDTALLYGEKALLLANKLKEPEKEAEALSLSGTALSVMGNYPLAIDFLLNGLHIEEQLESNRISVVSYGMPLVRILCYNLAEAYNDQGDYEHALFYYNKGKPTGIISDDDLMESFLRVSMIYEKSNHLDSALIYGQKAYDLDIKMYGRSEREYIPVILGNVYFKKGNYILALQYYRIAQSNPSFYSVNKDAIEVCNGMAKIFAQTGEPDSSIYYAQKALQFQKLTSYPLGALNTYGILANIYKKRGEFDSTVKYLEQTITLRDSLFNQRKNQQVQNLSFNEQMRQQEIQQEKTEYQNKIKMYALLGVVAMFLVIASLLYRNNQHKQKANVLLVQQKEKVESTLTELKSTQSQLIQSEKMASLGELTAGIAHEIQNPLNFVNNFSEVNQEMVDELQTELKSGNVDEAIAISNYIKDNSEKINHHGKRADAIVKGMLQHSRSSTGVKEPTDINALADEYLRLSYHGMRAKDKTFNAIMKTEFDESIGKINIIPQDIGRVLLNLYNNAFYSVTEKAKNPPPLTGSKEYEPTVTVSTRSVKSPSGGLGVQLTVKDNGNGIPQKVIDKIFQPFFTTKPTGEGTGLGLSLSYDIIKAHGGEIKVETKENEGSEFIVQLPVKNV